MADVSAWARGARGERVVGERLAGVSGVRELNDRRIPGTRANIDHLVVGPAGIYVIDAKRYRGLVERRTEGFLRLRTRLFVGGRDRTGLVEGMTRQVAAVDAAVCDALEGSPAVIVPVLCFVDAEWRLFASKNLAVNGVHVIWPGLLERLVTRPGPLDDRAISVLAARLAERAPCRLMEPQQRPGSANALQRRRSRRTGRKATVDRPRTAPAANASSGPAADPSARRSSRALTMGDLLFQWGSIW